MSKNPVFSTRLRRLRESNNLNQRELAEAIGICRSSITLMESGDRFTSLDVLMRLCECLNTSSDYLLGFTDEVEASFPPVTPLEQSLILSYRKKPKNIKAVIQQILEV